MDMQEPPNSVRLPISLSTDRIDPPFLTMVHDHDLQDGQMATSVLLGNDFVLWELWTGPFQERRFSTL